MEAARARALLSAERERLEPLLADATSGSREDSDAAAPPGDIADSAEPLTSEGGQNAVADQLRSELAAVERAEARLAAGTYGLSVKSHAPIPDERLEADPTAELTVEEEREQEEREAT